MAGGGIFLSYRREDTRHFAGRLYDHLTERFGQATVFIDVDSTEPGLDFGILIEQAVSQWDLLLAIIGRKWVDSRDGTGRRRLEDSDDWVSLEISAALRRDVRGIPVLVDGARVPRREELPDALQGLARRGALRVDHETSGATCSHC